MPTSTFVLVVIISCTLVARDVLATTKKKDGSVKRMILLDRTPVLPDRVRLLAECADGDRNCTHTCPESYTLDARKQTCRPKRQDGRQCPPGYVLRAGAGGAGGCVLDQEDIQCPPGSTREGNRCVVRSFSCPSGYTRRGQNCLKEDICQPGYRWESGLCFPSSARRFCPAGFVEQRGGNCAPAACSDCCDCRDEVAGAVCPAGYASQWGRCVKLLQASPDLRIQSVMYRLPVECPAGASFNEGQCEEWAAVGRPVCRAGHLYNGSCVEVAKCNRGTLNHVCSCELEQHVTGSCTVGKLNEGVCVLARVHCRAPFRLLGGVCVRESKIRPTCPDGGVPFQQGYCALEVPRCGRGFSLDSNGLCRKEAVCAFECGPYQQRNKWCGFPATCPEGYTLGESGHCVRETIRPAHTCPEGTVERGERGCVSLTPICRSNFRYDPAVDQCTRCEERPLECARGNLTGGQCVWSEPACPGEYSWKDSMCVWTGTRRAFQCRRGYEEGELCVHGELACPAGYELLGESCVTREDVQCPEGSYPLDGRCTIAKECPEHFQAGPQGTCLRENRRLDETMPPTCPGGFAYEGEVCVRRSVVEPLITRKEPRCPEGYDTRDGCVRTIRTFAVCPPRTIFTDRSDRCYCEVDLTCPTGYERAGSDCQFRAAGYTSLVNFLNPCYGAFCEAGAYCIAACSFPPCPFEPCSTTSLGATFGATRRCLTPGAGPEDDCPPQAVIGLVCPPGYERVNSSCLAYYDKVCPEGYELDADECTRAVRLEPICPPGYRADGGSSCVQVSCPNGYKLMELGGSGEVCEKRELRSPKACPPGWDFFQGTCHRRASCRNGTIEGPYCVEREYARPTCPEGFQQREDDCATDGSCRGTGATLIDGTCIRIATPLPCPEGTYRQGKHCVYPDAPECDEVPFVATNCTSEVDSGGQCRHRTSPTCPKGYRRRDDRCIACQLEKLNCPPNMALREQTCVAERLTCPEGHFLRDGHCVMLHVVKPRCSSSEYTLCQGFCIVAYTHECKGIEYGLPTCGRGFQHRGRCVEPGRCTDAEHALINGECHVRVFSDPSCHGKGSRVGERCINGTPQCPPNYALVAGQCYSRHIENAHCPASGSCADSFCQLEPPRCSAPAAMFDGTACRQLTTAKPVCPVGTSPDRLDASLCQLKSEKAVYNCPPEYHYQNGVCLKKLYKNASCPVGYNLRGGACVKRVCSRMSSGSVCVDASSVVTSSGAISCTQCLNDTTSSAGPWGASTASESVDLCCSVYSPRICRGTGECYHEREHLCGSFCLTENDRIYLTVSRTMYVGTRLYVAPRQKSDDDDYYNGNGENDEDGADSEDCQQCVMGPVNCPKRCNTYECESDDGMECNYQDAATFCAQYKGVKLCTYLLHRG
ncbi:neurogenic locus notch homolog protein 1-like [Anopheles nili]|uniref:neurogenic locus notch homolog protein 1-like n=1 Tax=Anopheles nili TaxID=185578 RepID=UPI00237C3E0A|nr:neurogenic locus notch homolog protein 1-like [Anopheles nili]